MATTTAANTECVRIADQLRNSFAGDAWHGPSIQELLSDVTAEQAYAHPVATAHSIWELVLHIGVWTRLAAASTDGIPMPAFVENMPPEQNWPLIKDSGPEAWKTAKDETLHAADELAAVIEQFGDDRLGETVPGRSYGFYKLFHGIVQHSLYHAGQVAILKRAVQAPA